MPARSWSTSVRQEENLDTIAFASGEAPSVPRVSSSMTSVRVEESLERMDVVWNGLLGGDRDGLGVKSKKKIGDEGGRWQGQATDDDVGCFDGRLTRGQYADPRLALGLGLLPGKDKDKKERVGSRESKGRPTKTHWNRHARHSRLSPRRRRRVFRAGLSALDVWRRVVACRRSWTGV